MTHSDSLDMVTSCTCQASQWSGSWSSDVKILGKTLCFRTQLTYGLQHNQHPWFHLKSLLTFGNDFLERFNIEMKNRNCLDSKYFFSGSLGSVREDCFIEELASCSKCGLGGALLQVYSILGLLKVKFSATCNWKLLTGGPLRKLHLASFMKIYIANP